MKLSKKASEKIKELSIAAYPKEACGFILKGQQVVQCENTSKDPENSFRINNLEYLKYVDDIKAVWHSHPGGPDAPSQADMERQLELNVPFIIVSCDEGGAREPFKWGDNERPELVGRNFRHGVTDCYALVRDYFLLEKKIKLNDYPRNDRWWESGEENLYLDNFIKEGFEVIDVSEVQPGDCFLAKVQSPVVNHAGVVLENGLILHHLWGRLSRKEPLARWPKFITLWLRYVGDKK